MQKPRRKSRRRRTSKPKICRFCESKVNYIDFKDPDTLRKFQTEKGKILPRRITGTCLEHQKMLSTAIKRARIISLVY
ncbi:MAG: 30S ribosomal protein S18 [Lentisphaerae bacterium]|nr:30S ribosomal protein S18 [Lentisphaerota bacterium]MCP4100195.1 30S ribosomal protein S18 [Lentisphaerota bacterium]